MSASPPDFTEFLYNTNPPLPDLQGLNSQLAISEWEGILGGGQRPDQHT